MSELKKCRYCGNFSQLLNVGMQGYPYKSNYGPMYVCSPCKAWVGCHKGTTTPLGGLANSELRKWKIKAHSVFDPLWIKKQEKDKCSKRKARTAGYKWLSEKLGIPFEKTHIGYMSVEECKKVFEICSVFFKDKNTK